MRHSAQWKETVKSDPVCFNRKHGFRGVRHVGTKQQAIRMGSFS